VRVTITPTLVHDKIVLALKVSTDGVIEPQSKLMVMQIREDITDGENLFCVGFPKTEPGGRDLFVLATAHLVK
jgi:hypothetical protein